MSKAYKVTKRTVMFDKENPKTVFSVMPGAAPKACPCFRPSKEYAFLMK